MGEQAGGEDAVRFKSKEDAVSQGFTVDTTCYPWFAYKGPRFNPTEYGDVPTTEQARVIESRNQLTTVLAAARALRDEMQRCHQATRDRYAVVYDDCPTWRNFCEAIE